MKHFLSYCKSTILGKSIVVGLLITVFSVIGISKADEAFLNNLKIIGISVDTLDSQQALSRYELTRLFNAVDCKDCINPDKNFVDTYTSTFWTNFINLPGKDFADIMFGGAMFNSLSHYYCVAYVGDNGYMRGYPKTNSYFPGEFGGTNNVTVGEFYQVVVNLIGKLENIYRNYAIERSKVKSWMDKIRAGSPEDGYVDADSRKIIEANAKICTRGKCTMKNNADFQVYLKYCMFNINECNMKEFGALKQARRPIAELNILVNQNIVDINDSDTTNLDKSVNGKKVLEVIQKLNDLVGCEFNDDYDYDCDEIKNSNDNAPNNYNPKQKDTDGDGIGDVADDDIDGDGIKNPVGFVDDNGYINVGSLVGWIGVLDNCVFTVNADQEDEDNDVIGNACQGAYDKLGLSIAIKKLTSDNGVKTTFQAVTQGTFESIAWDFGDGAKGNGVQVDHSYTKPGLYKVTTLAKGPNNEAKAMTTVFVGENQSDYHALQIQIDTPGSKFTKSYLDFSLASRGRFDKIERVFSGGTYDQDKVTTVFAKYFPSPGVFPITANGYKNGKIVASSHMTVGIGTIAIGSMLEVKGDIRPNINQNINLNTEYFGFSGEELKNISRNFGDGSQLQDGKNPTNTHIYLTAGKKIIQQKIYLVDGSILTNHLTIYVVDQSKVISYGLELSADNLVANLGKPSNFQIQTVGALLPGFVLGVQQYELGSTEKFYATNKFPLTKSYTYATESIFSPQTTVYVDKCIVLQSNATVVTKGIDMCLEAQLAGTLNTTFTCDMDKDGIPDICDADIDGDGVKNLLGMIKFENADCSINAGNMSLYIGNNASANSNTSNADSQKTSINNTNAAMLSKHFSDVCSLDNCPFSINADQVDINRDGFGNTCQGYDGGGLNGGAGGGAGGAGNNGVGDDTGGGIGDEGNGLGNGGDSDGDGIPDTEDACVLVPEIYNGTSDLDGCPELGIDPECAGIIGGGIAGGGTLGGEPPVIEAICDTCPCQFADFSSQLVKDDTVKALLRDYNKKILYKFSNPVKVY